MDIEGTPIRSHVRRQRVFRRVPEPELFPLDIESKLGPDDIARQVKAGISAMGADCLRDLYEDHGGIAYDPVGMLSIVMLAWIKGVDSSREIEDRCQTDIRFMYVSGGMEPDYRSILRFLKRISPVIEDLQRRFIETCIEIGFLQLRRMALDGTKVRSASSQCNRWLKTPEAKELEELGFEVPGTTDPDARVMRSREGKILGYNVQAVVDCDTGLVLASDVSQCSADRHLLGEMAEKVVSTCGESATDSELVADAGYDSYEGLQTCENLGLDVTVPPQDDSALFWTAVSESEVVCPMGESPTKITAAKSHGQLCQKYTVPTCPSCPFYFYCMEGRRRRGRSLCVPLGCDPVHRVLQAHRARSPVGREALRERMATVEPFFGDMKWNRGRKRLRRRGLAGARLETGLNALARNVRILGRALVALLGSIFRLLETLFVSMWSVRITHHTICRVGRTRCLAHQSYL